MIPRLYLKKLAPQSFKLNQNNSAYKRSERQASGLDWLDVNPIATFTISGISIPFFNRVFRSILKPILQEISTQSCGGYSQSGEPTNWLQQHAFKYRNGWKNSYITQFIAINGRNSYRGSRIIPFENGWTSS